MKAYIIAPPIIWGLATGRLVDAGLQNPVMSGLLVMSRLAIYRGSFGIVGPGLNVWSAIEVNDRMFSLIVSHDPYIHFSIVANLFLVIFSAVVIEGKEIAGGSAYYFASNGDLVFKDMTTKAAQALHKYGALKSGEPTEFTSDEMKKVTNPSSIRPSHPLLTNRSPQSPSLAAFGVNCRISDSRARSLGWKPVHATSEILDDIDRNIKVLVTQRGDFGASWGMGFS